MKTSLAILLASLCSLALGTPRSAPGAAFTYQGQLTTNGSPAHGNYDFQFTLFGAESGGNPVEAPVTSSAVGLTNGVFTVLLDFGANVFTGQDRWLGISVRPVGGEAFTPLAPRQPILPTPYALTALKVPGLERHALHAPNGSITNAVIVDNGGNVGIGTTTPQERLDVRSGEDSYVRVDTANGDIKVNGGSDGHWGIFNDGPASGGTHLIGQGISRLFVANTGNVGVGTPLPRARLDVRGDVTLGSNGELDAVGSPERLRLVRGSVLADGTIRSGFGFLAAREEGNRYVVTFSTPFAETPTITASVFFISTSSGFIMPSEVSASRAEFRVYDAAGNVRAGSFNFIAVGRR